MNKNNIYLTPAQGRLISAQKQLKHRKEDRRKAREIFDRALQNLIEKTEQLALAEDYLNRVTRAFPEPPPLLENDDKENIINE